MSFNQIHGGCELYDGGECENGGSIAYGGGIFNDNVKAYSTDNSKYWFRYRAMPDSLRIPYQVDIGKWMSFTYEIYWTHSNNGYWRLWKDGELLSSEDNVKTLPDCCGDDSNFLQFKTGLYNKWNDAVIDSLPLYFDDVELYIGDNINVENVCAECFGNVSTEEVFIDTQKEQVNLFPNPVKDYLNIQCNKIPQSITIYSSEGKEVKHEKNTEKINVMELIKGMYLIKIDFKESSMTKYFIKE